ncbi:TPA: aminoglycoside adenylyltransferase, partial [Enterococcus faecalis]
QDFAKMAQFTYHLQEAKKVTEYTNSLRLKDLQGK